jgi:hypothetical protein
MNDLLSSISKFYHRWHSLEATLADGVQVLDFDFCPREDISNLEPPFVNRLEALRQVEELRSLLAISKPERLCNSDFMSQKLAGAAMFLRGLMGERIAFEPYLRAMMGIEPEVISRFEIEAIRAELEERFSRLNISFSADGKAAFEQYIVLNDVSQFERSLRTEATYWVKVLQQRIGLTAQPTFEIEVVNEDAYWTNWIDGSLTQASGYESILIPESRF